MLTVDVWIWVERETWGSQRGQVFLACEPVSEGDSPYEGDLPCFQLLAVPWHVAADLDSLLSSTYYATPDQAVAVLRMMPEIQAYTLSTIQE